MFNPTIRSSLPTMARAFRASCLPSRMFTFRAQMLSPAMYSTEGKIHELVAFFKKKNPEAEKPVVLQFKKFLQLHPGIEKPTFFLSEFRIESLPHKNLILQMLQTPFEKLNQRRIDRVLDGIGFEPRKSRFLNYVECTLEHGAWAVLSVEDADYFVELSAKLQKARTIDELQTLYKAETDTPFSRNLATDEKLLFDFLLLGIVRPETIQALQNKCVHHESFPSFGNDYLATNKECFEQTKPVILNLLSTLTRDSGCFTTKPTIDFQALYETVNRAENQVDIRKALYSVSMCERFPLKGWEDITYAIRFKTDLHSNPHRVQERLWHIFKDPEKAGLKLPIDESFLRSYAQAMQFRIKLKLEKDDERHSSHRYYEGLYRTLSPKKVQIHDQAILEVIEALRNGQFELLHKRMQNIINTAKTEWLNYKRNRNFG